MKRALFALVFLLPCGAFADDRSHQFIDLQGEARTDSWWSSFAECVGRAKSLVPFASVIGHATPEVIEERANMFWIISVSRLTRDRDVSQDEAIRIAGGQAQLAYQWQQDSNLVYTAASKMDWEFDRQITLCESHLRDYAAAFPEDFQH